MQRGRQHLVQKRSPDERRRERYVLRSGVASDIESGTRLLIVAVSAAQQLRKGCLRGRDRDGRVMHGLNETLHSRCHLLLKRRQLIIGLHLPAGSAAGVQIKSINRRVCFIDKMPTNSLSSPRMAAQPLMALGGDDRG